MLRYPSKGILVYLQLFHNFHHIEWKVNYWKDVAKFYEIADDIKSGEHGTQLIDAIYGSSVGFKGDALVELENLSKSRKDDAENKLEFKTANFENRIYSVVKC